MLDAAGYGPDAVSVHQLSEVSGFIRSLDDRPLPARVARVSIAARGDLVVASPRTAAADFPNVVVDLGGLAGARRPARPAPPSPGSWRWCGPVSRPPAPRLGDLVLDVIAGEGVSWATDALGASLLPGTAPQD